MARKPVRNSTHKIKIDGVNLKPQKAKVDVVDYDDESTVMTTFEEHQTLIEKFFTKDSLGLVVEIGRPGISKSYAAKTESAKLPGEVMWISGKSSAFKVYQKLYRGRNKLVVLNDAELLWSDKSGRILLRDLTEMSKRKVLSWETSSSLLAKLGIPNSFSTTSRVLIIANQLKFGDKYESGALKDRGHPHYFEPSTLQVHEFVGGWFWDQEIYDYFSSRLHLMVRHSCRRYVKCSQRKQAGMDWRRVVDEQYCFSGTEEIFRKIYDDKSFPTIRSKVAEFVKLGGGCSKTWYNYLHRLAADLEETRVEPKRVTLKATRPPVEPEVDDFDFTEEE
jgi:hypothetical protein